MAFLDIDSEQHATYGTHSHGEETLVTPGGQYPSQLKWSDLHPPGVKVLPKGSPPAGEGEINWEDTLGGKFALAMEKLEGLLYAVFGSRPHAEPDGQGGWIKRQWYDRRHPRCLWGPETWERRLIMGYTGCTEVGQCWDYQETGKEYAALGEQPPCCPLPKPSVPIRSRSGDPAGQFASYPHDETYFPVGSVSRNRSDAPFDPEGSGWFGATQPGRQDGVGYDEKAGEDVTFSWTKPDGVQEPTEMRLYYRTRAPGGVWPFRWSYVAMTNGTGGAPTYSATLGPYPHGTELQWYVWYKWQDEISQLIVRDPYFEWGWPNPPYYLQWYTHYNPYAHGLPEMLADYGGVDLRHGTDFYQFDGSETVQYELIDMVRWILSWLGGDCCTGEYDTCAETDSRCDTFHHNPRFRGADDGLCCVPMPIRFRWSGSNVHPHYMTGGKAGGLDTQPLLNTDEDAGSQAARKTWRGINLLYADGEHFDNPFYGGGYSWGTAPGTFVLMYKPNHDPFAQVWAKYPYWGLRAGDVIEAVHLQEIIDAVDYLVDRGVWTTIPICTRKRTPGQFMGIDCGYYYYERELVGSGFWGEEYRKACDKCCANVEECYPYDHALGYWYHSWNPANEDEYTEYPDTCIPWSVPTWEECTDPCEDYKCHMIADKWGGSLTYNEGNGCDKRENFYALCDGGGAEQPHPSPGCGYHRTDRNCYDCVDWDPLEGCLEWAAAENMTYYCHRHVEGYSYYACTPNACNDGWDDDHGGLFKKNRYDHVWHPGL